MYPLSLPVGGPGYHQFHVLEICAPDIPCENNIRVVSNTQMTCNTASGNGMGQPKRPRDPGITVPDCKTCDESGAIVFIDFVVQLLVGLGIKVELQLDMRPNRHQE